MAKRNFVALDTHFLLDLERGDVACQEVIDFFNGIGWFCLATETAREELADIEFNDGNPEIRILAATVLRRLGIYSILTPDLRDVERDIAKLHAQRFCETELIKDAQANDALALTEAASHNCLFLITDRAQLIQSDADSLKLALAEKDLTVCTVLSLDLIVSILRRFEELRQQHKKSKQ